MKRNQAESIAHGLVSGGTMGIFPEEVTQIDEVTQVDFPTPNQEEFIGLQ